MYWLLCALFQTLIMSKLIRGTFRLPCCCMGSSVSGSPYCDRHLADSLYSAHSLLDMIILRSAALTNVLHTRSYHSADGNTAHSLMCCRIRLQPKRFHRTKKQGNPRIDVSKMSQPILMSQVAEAFEREFGAPQPKDSATEKWENLRDTKHRTALATFAEKTSKTHDWFDAKSTEMRPVGSYSEQDGPPQIV